VNQSLIDIRESTKLFPYFIYKRLEIKTAREFFFHKLDYGYGYFLRRLVARWPAFVYAGSTRSNSPELNFEFFDKSKHISRQIEPIPGNLMFTPGQDGDSIAESTPVDLDNYGYNFPSSQPKGFKLLNYFYMYGSQIELQITGQAGMSGTQHPFFVDLLLSGYYLQEKSLPLWNTGV
jgi:hypothetical protein